MKKDLIRIENHGRSTYLYIAGIRLGKGILGINFSQTEEEPMTPKLTVTVDVRAFLQELSEIKPEELEQAKEGNWIDSKTLLQYLGDGTLKKYYESQQKNFIDAGDVDKKVPIEDYVLFDVMEEAGK